MVWAFRGVLAYVIKFQLQMRQNKMHLNLSQLHCKIVLQWDFVFKVRMLLPSVHFL